jgi:peptide/nickel transport system ATP-binding protein
VTVARPAAPLSDAPLLEVRDLSVLLRAGDRRVAAVSDASLVVRRGEVVGLVGESGAGKTMVARAVTALLPAGAETQGQVLLDGRDVLVMNGEELRRHRGAGAALCFQSPRRALSPVRRVGAQIDDRLAAHAPEGARQATALSLLEAVGIRDPERRLAAYPHELSGGMAQRVMIALALACHPQLLVADEPTTGLDVTLTRSILALLRAAADREGRGVLVISHDVAAIAEVCDRIAVMYGGLLVEEGPAAQVLAAPAHPYTRALIDAVPDISGAPTRAVPGTMPQLGAPPASCPFVPRCPRAEPACSAARPPEVQVAEGRRALCLFAGEEAPASAAASGAASAMPPVPAAAAVSAAAAAVAAAPADPLLRITDLEVVYGSRFGKGGHRALRGVSIEVARGETLGVVGESGCGKSTLARAALGLVRPKAGSIAFDGQDIGRLGSGELRRLRTRMQMVFQDPVDTLDPRRTVEQTLTDSLRAAGVPAAEREARIAGILERVGLDPVLRGRRRAELSGGQAQRVGIARALVLDPDLVVFDEPTSALDVTIQAQILELIESLMQERSRAYVYVSHDLATVRATSDRVAVLYLGTVVESGPTERLFTRPLHPYTRALLSSVPSLHGTAAATEPVELRRDLDDAPVAAGCVLAARCPFATDRCLTEAQALTPYEPGHLAACWRIPEIE